MIAFGVHLLESGAMTVELHPDGEHAKKYDIRGTLEALGFHLVTAYGRTNYGGTYRRGHQIVSVTIKPGFGDVVADVGKRHILAECKGGIVNTRHPGQLSRLRRGICEAVGLLMARPLDGERQVAVVPQTEATQDMARRMFSRAKAAGIEIALVDEDGRVTLVRQSR